MSIQHDPIDTPGKLAEAERVDMAEFCTREPEEFSESIHIRFDKQNSHVALFRNIGDAGGRDWIRTDVECRVNLTTSLRGERPEQPDGFFLHASPAETLLTFLDRLRVERSDAKMAMEWWEQNNSEMIEQHDLDQESLFFHYRTDSGRENRIEISDVYSRRRSMMAKF